MLGDDDVDDDNAWEGGMKQDWRKGALENVIIGTYFCFSSSNLHIFVSTSFVGFTIHGVFQLREYFVLLLFLSQAWQSSWQGDRHA